MSTVLSGVMFLLRLIVAGSSRVVVAAGACASIESELHIAALSVTAHEASRAVWGSPSDPPDSARAEVEIRHAALLGEDW
jgi:hypothetical protein